VLDVSIARLQSRVNFLLIQILICFCRSQVFELCHIFKVSVSYLNVMIFVLHSGYEISAFTSRPSFLLLIIRVSMFSLCYLY
jgi:hypothetical protein